MTAYSTRNGFLKPLAFGVRRAIGVCPPSKLGLIVSRAPWHFGPRPAVLPPLPAIPRPTRWAGVLAPVGGLRSCSLMGMSVDLFDLDEMGNSVDHPSDLGTIRVLDRVV